MRETDYPYSHHLGRVHTTKKTNQKAGTTLILPVKKTNL